MTVETRLSAGGRVFIPKDVRDRLGFAEGTLLDVIERDDGVFLRRKMEPRRKGLTVEEATERLRKIIRYDGPPIPIERLSWSASVDREFEQSNK